MKDNISFTIPIEASALERTADMLTHMAADLLAELNIKKIPAPIPDKTVKVEIKGKNLSHGDVEKLVDTINKEVIADASTVFSKNVVPLHQGNAPPPAPPVAEIPPVPAVDVPLAPVGVELDSDGLPWDARIHGNKKLKLAKTQQWKKKRGIDPVLVETVEAELHAAMSAGKTQVVEADTMAPVERAITDDIPPPHSTASSTSVVDTPPTPPVGITFPELMSKITTAMGAGTMSEAMVIAACNNQGLASLPLLAVRPDLISTVNAELFPS